MCKTYFTAPRLFCAQLRAQNTATLTGNVTVRAKPFEGVTVTIPSPALRGTRTTLTGEAGAYRFANLSPGECHVVFTHDALTGGEHRGDAGSLAARAGRRGDADRPALTQ